jgi:stage II sporulation protein E
MTTQPLNHKGRNRRSKTIMKGMKKRVILIHLIGFIVARASFFGMNPLAIGYFTASYLGKTGGGLAFAVTFLGIATVMNPTQILKYTLTMIATVIFMEAPMLKNRNIPKPILYMIPSVALCIFSFMEITAGGPISWYVSLAVLEAVIAVTSAGLFKNGIDYIMQAAKGFKMNNEQMVSTAVIVAVIIYAIPDIPSSYFAPVETAVYFIILFFTYKYGVGQGTITGAVCGFALSLRGAPLADVGLLTMMGIIPAIFREMGRFPTAFIYLTTASVLGIVNEGMEFTIREIGALVSAVLLFLLLPSSLIYRVDAAGGTGRQELLASQNLRKIAKTRMKIFSESFLKLSKTLDTITEKQTKLKQKEINRIFEDISEKLCKNCDNCNDCWENKFQQTYQAACVMFDVAEKKGIIGKEDIPANFLVDCISVDEFIVETNRGFEIAKLNHIWQSRISESREVIAEQLKEVSSVIQDVTGDIYEAAEVARSEEERVARRLRSEHILTRDITIFERGDKRKEIYLSAACRSGRCITAKEAALVLTDALGVRIKVSEASKSVITKDYENFIFVEDTKFKILTGVARAMKENVSGDNFSVLKLETGEMMIALSDGMGTGKDAGEESETVMALLEQMIEAGFKAETAIKLINSSLVLKSDRQTFSTIDLSIINLYTGMCEFIKIGAAAAFIKRENWVETISSTTLPIGMFGNVDYDTITKKLYEGDIIIMVTDGVLDCIEGDNKEAFMEQMIMELKSQNPQEIANRILDRTLSQSNYVPMDDMTVITAGIWLK